MKILFLTSVFNGMAQRAWIELDRLNHQVKVHISENEDSMNMVVNTYQPELIIAPFLTKKIPTHIWKNNVCLIIHPGIPGDRGASSLDWAILNDEVGWGVTIIQAVEKMDDGPIWASTYFRMRSVSKGQLYRHEVTQAAMDGLLEAVDQFQEHGCPKQFHVKSYEAKGRYRPKTTCNDYKFNWVDPTPQVIKKILAADSAPGAKMKILNTEYLAFGAHLEENLSGKPGTILAHRDKAICVACGEQAVWITHLKTLEKDSIKLPAACLINPIIHQIKEDLIDPFDQISHSTFREIWYDEEGDIGFIHFNFYNGAMDVDQCTRLRHTIVRAKLRPTKVLVLMGGEDLWCNGIHLNVIENKADSSEESWKNILAINDLIEALILTTSHFVICALQGNAGAGGVPFALAGDKIIVRKGIILNPHTKNMGLYGSEYWTYLLPRRIGIEKSNKFTDECLPWGTSLALEIGLIDEVVDELGVEFRERVKQRAKEIAALSYFDKLLKAKSFQRKKDERLKPLAKYREAELEKMRKNFFENDWGYHEKRNQFVHKKHSIDRLQDVEEKDLFSSRRNIYRKRKWESIDYKL